MASTNLISKISRAVAHYLVSATVVPFDRCYPMTTRRQRTLENGPIVSVLIPPGSPNPRLEGNFSFPVHVVIRGSAVKHPENPDDETERLAFDALVGACYDALMLADDSAGQEGSLKETMRLINVAAYTMPIDSGGTEESAAFAVANADMDDFTITAWHNIIYGPGKAEDCDWEIVLGFECDACETKLTGYV